MRRLVLALIPLALFASACSSGPKGYMPMAGGYGPANPDDPQVAKARQLAIAEVQKRYPSKAEVKKIEGESQIVAGVNYHFRIFMTGWGGARYDVFISRTLQGDMTITRVEKVK